MYLKKLDMVGFKSFKDKISISFDSNITAIVGPNGSGKSNITDAIRWVLGEQSVKSLRGSRMEDVIFAGTAKHKPLGFAEVSLTLDNSTGLFPSDYTELCVTRRVYRSGESEYMLNKVPCRLKDIQEIFMDTGLGRDGYSIIGQGKIDAILSAKAEDRRQIFEEAAGISKYKYRKNEASRKLVATEENLVRLRDISSELSARIGPLEAQARKARTYLDLYEKLKRLEINLSLLDIRNLQEQKKISSALFADSEQTYIEKSAFLHALQEKEQSLFSKMKDRDIEMEKSRSLLHGTALSIKEWEGECALWKQRIADLNDREKRILDDIAQKEDDLTLLKDEIQHAKDDIQTNTESLSQAETEVMNAEHDVEAAGVTITTQSMLTDSLHTNASRILLQAEDTKRRIETLLNGDAAERLKALTAEYEATQNKLSENKKAKESYAEKKHQLEQSAAKLSDEFNTLVSLKPKLTTKLQSLKNTYNQTLRDLNIRLSRQAALSDMEQNMEGYGKGVRAIVNAHLPAQIHGVLSKLIHVQPNYVTAVETALGGALQNIVVGTEEDAKLAIEYLKKTHNGRATFLPISAIHGRRLEQESSVSRMPGFVGLACDLVDCDAIYNQIILHLLGNVVVVKTIDNAIVMTRKFSHQFKIVTIEGELFLRGGSISGGSRGGQTGLLGRSDEIERLCEECDTLQQSLDETEEQIDATEDKIEDLIRKIEDLRTEARDLESEKLNLAGSIQLCDTLIENEEKQKARLQSDMDSTRAQILNADSERVRLTEEYNQLTAQHEAALQNVSDARTLLQTKMQERDTLRDILTQRRVAVNSIEKDLEANQAQLLLIENNMQKLQETILHCHAEIESITSTRKEIQLRLNNRQIDIENAKTQVLSMQANLDKMLDEKGDADRQAAKLRTDIQTQNEYLSAMLGEKARLEAKMEKVQEHLDSTINHLWDAYELTYSAAEAYREDIGDPKEARNQAADLRRSVRALGSVNVDAIEEYAAVKERYDFMETQINDLEKARGELQKIIIDMTQVMTETFATQFAQIAACFKETFAALFGGGTGKLILSDPSHVLESGIEIDIQPPGKKLQSLSLLSGGEKALTAIAILFAVMRVKPAPFCILDEIESALDDHNIARFSSYLRDYEQTQFIIVTHRRGTMEAADILYGVTMQEKGISKILTMRLDRTVDGSEYDIS
ncbi:MAG: chromosome segregation protein SMC [Clostridia bacterium]|nr:chromosome segregation protein SMC [Clostridia bacterium]